MPGLTGSIIVSRATRKRQNGPGRNTLLSDESISVRVQCDSDYWQELCGMQSDCTCRSISEMPPGMIMTDRPASTAAVSACGNSHQNTRPTKAETGEHQWFI